MASSFLKTVALATIGAIDFSREKLGDARDALGDSLDDFVKRGEQLNDTEDSLSGALLAALNIKPKVPTADEVDSLIPGYDDMTVTEILDQIKSVPTKQLEMIRLYEQHNHNRIRVIRQIDKELDEVRIIPEYDKLPVGEVVDQLDELTPQQLAALKDYEKTHRNRVTILRAIDRMLASPA